MNVYINFLFLLYISIKRNFLLSDNFLGFQKKKKKDNGLDRLEGERIFYGEGKLFSQLYRERKQISITRSIVRVPT